MVFHVQLNFYKCYFMWEHSNYQIYAITLWAAYVEAVSYTHLPWLYQKLSEKEYGKIQELSRYLLIIVAGVSIIPIVFAPEIIAILGSDCLLYTSRCV